MPPARNKSGRGEKIFARETEWLRGLRSAFAHTLKQTPICCSAETNVGENKYGNPFENHVIARSEFYSTLGKETHHDAGKNLIKIVLNILESHP